MDGALGTWPGGEEPLATFSLFGMLARGVVRILKVGRFPRVNTFRCIVQAYIFSYKKQQSLFKGVSTLVVAVRVC